MDVSTNRDIAARLQPRSVWDFINGIARLLMRSRTVARQLPCRKTPTIAMADLRPGRSSAWRPVCLPNDALSFAHFPAKIQHDDADTTVMLLIVTASVGYALQANYSRSAQLSLFCWFANP